MGAGSSICHEDLLNPAEEASASGMLTGTYLAWCLIWLIVHQTSDDLRESECWI